MDDVRSKDLDTSANHHIEPTIYTEYINWYNEEELMEMPPTQEQNPRPMIATQRMGVEAYQAARLANYNKAQKDDPNMSLEGLAQALQEARTLDRHVNKELRETEKREDTYDRNRRSFLSPGLAAIANPAIA